MARSRKGFFARLGDALRDFWHTVSEPEPESKRGRKAEEKRTQASIERARRPLPPRPFGVPEPKRPEKKPPPPPEPPVEGLDWDNHGPYPEHWTQSQRDLWDSEPQTYRQFYTADEWEQLQEAFDYGWFHHREGMSKEEHEQWRQRFYDISGVTESSFDWEEFRAYIAGEFGY